MLVMMLLIVINLCWNLSGQKFNDLTNLSKIMPQTSLEMNLFPQNQQEAWNTNPDFIRRCCVFIEILNIKASEFSKDT